MPLDQVPPLSAGELVSRQGFHVWLSLGGGHGGRRRAGVGQRRSPALIQCRRERRLHGRHRIAGAALEGREDFEAVQFDEDPALDCVGAEPDEFPYLDGD